MKKTHEEFIFEQQRPLFFTKKQLEWILQMQLIRVNNNDALSERAEFRFSGCDSSLL